MNTIISRLKTYFINFQLLVYFAFGWEGINDEGPAQREIVMERVLTWLDQVTGIEDRSDLPISQSIHLFPNYPNPFNPTTSIEFSIPKSKFVTLKIYNILGEEVVTLVSEKLPAGKYKYEWDASGMASGVYLYRLEAGNQVEVRKMVLMK